MATKFTFGKGGGGGTTGGGANKFSFGKKASTTGAGAATTGATKTGGFSFGAKSATKSATSGTGGKGFSFGKGGAGGGAATPKTPTTSTPKKTGFAFGKGAATGAAATPGKSALAFGAKKPADAAAAAPTKKLSFGSTARTGASASGSATSTSKFSLGKTATTAKTTTTTSSKLSLGSKTTTSASTQEAAKRLGNKSVEQIINEWSTDLEMHIKLFNRQAIEVGKWDRQVLENGQKIFKLSSEVEQLQATQAELDRSLEAINTQQEEVHQLLCALEKDVEERSLAEPSAADAERDKGYRMAESLCAQLDQLGGALEQIVGNLNGPDTSDADSDNSLLQLVHILNNHQNSLAWIDRQTQLLDTNITSSSNGVSRF